MECKKEAGKAERKARQSGGTGQPEVILPWMEDVYDRYASLADPEGLLGLGEEAVARQIRELDGEVEAETARRYARGILLVAARMAERGEFEG